ncbi:MAG: hypothetical protein IPJ41_02220 [Phycisphaerales bacterium]|nr:hypothetical protein [Phycisphaerales bacterium]
MLAILPKERLQAYRGAIQTLQADPDSTLASRAAAQLDRLADGPSD